MDNRRSNKIIELTFQFSLDIIQIVEKLESNRKYVIANQLLKSGTSIGANVRESQNAESKSDFIHKLKIALKETDETLYWLELVNAAYKNIDSTKLIEDLKIIDKVLSKIVSTIKNKQKESLSN
ncbi:MAG: four helix bundle protein [Bacteroidetes bacterium]|nr:four helix bundle protein [Bacteroidota bacterium]